MCHLVQGRGGEWHLDRAFPAFSATRRVGRSAKSGWLARSLDRLDEDIAGPLIAKALRNADAYVRCHASSAADTAARFLGWPRP